MIALKVPDHGDEYFMRSSCLGFRWWRADDLGLAAQLWSDPKVTLHLPDRDDPDLPQKLLEEHMSFAVKQEMQYWPMFQVDTGEFIGCCGLRNKYSFVEYGIYIRSDRCEKGYGGNATERVLDYAFRDLGLDAIGAECDVLNTDSQALLRKYRFRKVHEFQARGQWFIRYSFDVADFTTLSEAGPLPSPE